MQRAWPLVPLIFAALLGPRLATHAGTAPDFVPARRVLEEAIADRAFPGCAVAAGTRDRVLWKEALGRFDYEGGPPATTRSLYDLASLTKVVGTTSVVMALVRDGKLSTGDPVSKRLPAFTGGGRENVAIEHLLTHSSGLPAWKPLHLERKGYSQVVEGALAAALETPPGKEERYSDLGFILLGEAAARAAGSSSSLTDLERKFVFEPLSMKDTIRNPPESEISRAVPTEVRRIAKAAGNGTAGAGAADDAPAGSAAAAVTVTRGTVHDENAAAGDGLTGHAGLFSTADDLAIFATELLRAWHGESRLFPRDLARRFFARRELVPGSSRALGWDTPSGQSSAGTLFGPHSFGHTGFTGTSMWIDPERGLYLILLTNRVHPTRENGKIAQVRRKLADAAVLCFDGKLRRL